MKIRLLQLVLKRRKGMNMSGLMIVFILFLPACANFGDRASSIFFPATENSFERKGEEVVLELGYQNKGTAPSRPELIPGTDPNGIQQHALVGAGEVAAAAGFIVDQISKYLEKESERYTATYSAVGVGDQFYGQWKSDASVNLEEITLNRTVESGDAVKINLKVIPTIDGTAFQVKPSYVNVERAKAKLASFALLDPFSWFSGSDNDLDLTVNLKMHAVWRDKKLKVHVQDLAEGEFKIRNVKLGAKYGGDGNPPVPGGDFSGKLFPMPGRSFLGEMLVREDKLLNLQDLNAEVANSIPPNDISLKDWQDRVKYPFEEKLAALKIIDEGISMSKEDAPPGMKWFKLADRSPVLGLGNIVVTILITENDDYGKKVKETSEKVGKRKDDVVKAVKEALE